MTGVSQQKNSQSVWMHNTNLAHRYIRLPLEQHAFTQALCQASQAKVLEPWANALPSDYYSQNKLLWIQNLCSPVLLRIVHMSPYLPPGMAFRSEDRKRCGPSLRLLEPVPVIPTFPFQPHWPAGLPPTNKNSLLGRNLLGCSHWCRLHQRENYTMKAMLCAWDSIRLPHRRVRIWCASLSWAMLSTCKA